jgi:hypothetical protein
MLYFFGLESKRFPAAPQRLAALKFGVGERQIIIEPRKEHAEFDYLISSNLRDGESDTLVAVHHLHLLAPGAGELRRRIRAIHAKGAVIVEVATGRCSDDATALADMVFEAHEVYTGRLLDPKIASRIGKLGAANSPRTKKLSGRDHMPKVMALPIWRDVTNYRRKEDALAAINADTNYRPYSMAYAYRRLGKRLAAAGRPTK